MKRQPLEERKSWQDFKAEQKEPEREPIAIRQLKELGVTISIGIGPLLALFAAMAHISA